MTKKILIVGGGLSGCILARIAKDHGWLVELHEKENEVGGLLRDCVDKKTKIRYSKYGAHIWHFSDKSKEALNFIKNYGEFMPCAHRVLALSNEGAFSLWPINLTYQKLFKEMHPNKDMFNKFVENYSKKMWNKNYKEVIRNIKDRFKFKNNYNTEFFENEESFVCLNYKELFKNLTQDILVVLNSEDSIDTIYDELDNFDWVVCTTPIDKFFKNCQGKLDWMGLDFKFLKLKCDSNVFPTSVVNTNSHPSIIRMVEYNQLFMETEKQNKIIGIETSSTKNNLCYPVMTKRNLKILSKYNSYKSHFGNLVFCGRSGTYSYENMDSCVMNSLSLFKQLKGGFNKQNGRKRNIY